MRTYKNIFNSWSKKRNLKSNKLVKSVAIVTVFSVLTRGISFLFKIYLSRKVGAEVMGLYQMAVTVFYLFAGISASGLSTVLSRKTAEDSVSGGKRSLSLTTSALVIGGTASLVIIGLLYIFKDAIPYITQDERAIPLFLIMAPALFTTTIYNVIRAYFWGKKDFTAFSTTETIEEIFRIVFTMLLVSGVVSGISGATGIAIAFTISDVAVAIILTALYFIKGGRLKKPTAIKELLKPALPVTGVRVFGSVVSTLLTILLPLGLIKAGYSQGDATAIFGRITGMANPLLFAPNAIISSLLIVLIPEMSESKATGCSEELNGKFGMGIKFSVLVSGIFMAVYLSIGKELCELLFNDVDAGIYLESAALLMIISPMSGNIAGTLNSIGREKEAFFMFLAGTALLIPTVVVLTPIIGMHSVVVGNGLSILASICLGMHYLSKYTSVKADFLTYALKTTLIVLPAYLVGEWIMGAMANAPAIGGVILAGGASGTIYLALCAVLGLVNARGFIHAKVDKKSVKQIEKPRTFCYNKNAE